MSGSDSFTSAIARSRCCGRKNCCPQCRSDSCTIRNIRGRLRVSASKRQREEALDHRVHLLGNLELVEVPGADGDRNLQIRLDLEQPEAYGIPLRSSRAALVRS